MTWGTKPWGSMEAMHIPRQIWMHWQKVECVSLLHMPRRSVRQRVFK